jgi:hypothetical protein
MYPTITVIATASSNSLGDIIIDFITLTSDLALFFRTYDITSSFSFHRIFRMT